LLKKSGSRSYYYYLSFFGVTRLGVVPTFIVVTAITVAADSAKSNTDPNVDSIANCNSCDSRKLHPAGFAR
jgi:hypothetical protein